MSPTEKLLSLFSLLSSTSFFSSKRAIRTSDGLESIIKSLLKAKNFDDWSLQLLIKNTDNRSFRKTGYRSQAKSYFFLCLFFLNLFLRLLVAILWRFLFFPLGILFKYFYN